MEKENINHNLTFKTETDENKDSTKKLDETIYFSPMRNTEESHVECEKKDASTQCEKNEKESTDRAQHFEQLRQIRKIFKIREDCNMENLSELKAEHARLKKHLTTLETAFVDVCEKYERTKSTIDEYKDTQEKLQKKLESTNEKVSNYAKHVHGMKDLMVDTLNKYNKQMVTDQSTYEREENNLFKSIKLAEIKIRSLQSNLAQVTSECEDVTNLLDKK